MLFVWKVANVIGYKLRTTSVKSFPFYKIKNKMIAHNGDNYTNKLYKTFFIWSI
jgi:hypothetical protein